MRELKLAVRSMPHEPAAHLQLARAYESTDRWMLAVDELQKLMVLAPDNAEYAYQLGKALAKLSEWSLQELSRVNPNSARLQQALGQEYAIQGKYDRALAAYQQAAKADPKLPEIHGMRKMWKRSMFTMTAPSRNWRWFQIAKWLPMRKQESRAKRRCPISWF